MRCGPHRDIGNLLGFAMKSLFEEADDKEKFVFTGVDLRNRGIYLINDEKQASIFQKGYKYKDHEVVEIKKFVENSRTFNMNVGVLLRSWDGVNIYSKQDKSVESHIEKTYYTNVYLLELLKKGGPVGNTQLLTPYPRRKSHIVYNKPKRRI